MIRVSKLTDYAVVLLSAMVEMEQGLVPASSLARFTGLPEPTVCKVLKLLTKSNIVLSVRGANGGYSLAQDINMISIATVIEAIDGPIALTACIDGSDNSCSIKKTCSIKDRWGDVNDAIDVVLNDIKLSDMVRPHMFIDDLKHVNMRGQSA